MKIYLAGPMNGIEDHNRPAFVAAAASLRAKGHEVLNPSEQPLCINIQAGHGEADAYRLCIADDLDFICREADAIAFLPGWEQSAGCAVEFHTAKACKLKFIYLTCADLCGS